MLHCFNCFQVGLIIDPEQPWLCCSPDGITRTGSKLQLIEIKCPYSLRNKCLIDPDNEISYVHYIHYVNGELELRKSHSYYTQIMMMLYVLRIDNALLYVYSPQRSIALTIQKDEAFLAEYVPKLKEFYFRYFLKAVLK